MREMGAAFRVRRVRWFLLAGLAACGVWLLVYPTVRPGTPRVVLSSGTDFGLSGSVNNLTPGLVSPLALSIANPFSVPITLRSVTVTVSPLSPAGRASAECPASGISLVSGSTVQRLTPGPGGTTLALHSPRPAIPARSSSLVSPFSLLLARTAGNECQLLTFPFRFSATATPSSGAAASSTTSVLPSASPAPALPSASLPETGAQIARLVGGAVALLLAGLLAVSLARRRPAPDALDPPLVPPRLLRAAGTPAVARLPWIRTRVALPTTPPLPVTGATPSGRSRRAHRWRVLAVVSLAAALGVLGAGLAFGFLTAAGVGRGSAHTGTVSIDLQSSGSRRCDYRSWAPGDSPFPPCTFSVVYVGSIRAYLSLTVLIETTASPARHAQPLYDPAARSGLTISIHDNQRPPVAYHTPAKATSCPASAPRGSICYRLDNELVSAGSFTRRSPSVTFTLAPSLSRSAGNNYQGSTATVVLSAQAVQAPANPLPVGCNATTTGEPCPASGTFSWR